MIPPLFQAALIVFAIAAIAMPAGSGGGMLYVPILLMLGVVETGNDAAALSQPITFGAALAGNMFNVLDQCRRIRRHRQSEGAESGQPPVQIDPRIIAVLLAPCLAGIIVGAILNQLLPECIILILLVFVIVWCFVNCIKKAVAMWKKESLAKAAAAAAAAPTPRRSSRSHSRRSTGAGLGFGCMARSSAGGHSISDDGALAATKAESEDRVLRAPASAAGSSASWPSAASTIPALAALALERTAAEAEKDEERGLPVDAGAWNASAAPAAVANGGAAIEALALPTALKSSSCGTSVTAPGRGSAVDWVKLLSVWAFLLVITALHGPSLIKTCSWGYWTTSAVAFLVLLGASIPLRHPKLATYNLVICGCLSAISGNSGGSILNPMMLRAGFDAPWITANVSVVVLLNCTIATFTFVMAGAVDPTDMAVLSSFSFFGSLLGKTLVGWAVARTGRTSLLVFLLSAFMLIACCMIVTEGSIKLKNSLDDPKLREEFFNFHDFCPQ